MKAIPLNSAIGYLKCDPEDATHVRIRMPGPLPARTIPVMIGGTRKGTPNWTWNGSIDKPTLKPSILTTDGTHRCHCFINDGKVQFLNDCSHELAGQTVDLLDIEQ